MGCLLGQSPLPHKKNYVVLCQQPQSLQLPPVLLTGGHDVDARGVDAAVTQNVRQLGDVLFQIVKRPGEEFPQIVWEYLARIYFCPFAQPLHGGPDVAAIQRFAVSGAENDASGDAYGPCVAQQELLQLAGKQYLPALIFAGHADLSPPHRFHREVIQLRDTDAGRADGLHQKPKAPVSLRRPQEPEVFRPAQFPLRTLVDLPLHPAQPHPTVRQAAEGKEAVHRRQHGVHRSQGVSLIQKLLLIGDDSVLGNILTAQITGKAPDVPEILFNGDPAFFLFTQVAGILCLQKFGQAYLFHGVSFLSFNVLSLHILHGNKNPTTDHRAAMVCRGIFDVHFFVMYDFYLLRAFPSLSSNVLFSPMWCSRISVNGSITTGAVGKSV